jgi:D-alanyl-D-alanine carboxypeptidase
MPYRNRLTVICCSLLALCTACGGGSGSTGSGGDHNGPGGCRSLPASTAPSGSLGQIVDELVASEMTTQGLPGVTVAVAKNGEILYAQGYGYADLGTCQPMQSAARLQIGSITKQFTAAAILQLQNSGAVELDKPVVGYLPKYAFDPRITVRMLLNQTSGLEDYLKSQAAQSYTGGPVAEDTVLNVIVQAPLLFTPGTAYAYSNSNYFVLGSILEAVTSVSYPDFLSTNVFPLAGLDNTSYTRPADSASPYVQGTNGPVPGDIPDPSAYFSAGALWSNVQDLVAWDAALLNGKVIPISSFDLMITPPAVPTFQDGAPSYYGMGWVAGGALAGHPFVWHNGGTISYTSFSGLLTDDGFSIAILTNFPVQEATPLLRLGQQLITAVCNSPTGGGC